MEVRLTFIQPQTTEQLQLASSRPTPFSHSLLTFVHDIVHKVMAGSQWQRVEDPISGRVYFYHHTTKETLWTKPQDSIAVAKFLTEQLGITELMDEL